MPQFPPVIILAGGKSERFGVQDKATAKLNGLALINHMISRLKLQTNTICISGSKAYGANLTVIPDTQAFNGPAAALHAIAEHFQDIQYFITVPVDAPFIPNDLVPTLQAHGPTTIAKTQEDIHPTVGIWSTDTLRQYFSSLDTGANPSLRKIAEVCNCTYADFPNAGQFLNINSKADLKLAESYLSKSQ